jgi:hypothetical protein
MHADSVGMKKTLTISLAILLLLLSVRDLLTFAAFKIHQDTIAAELCINRYEVVPMCFGQCFLDQQIEINKDLADHSGKAALPDISAKPVFFQSFHPLLYIEREVVTTPASFHYQDLRSQMIVRKLLEPPRQS